MFNDFEKPEWNERYIDKVEPSAFRFILNPAIDIPIILSLVRKT